MLPLNLALLISLVCVAAGDLFGSIVGAEKETVVMTDQNQLQLGSDNAHNTFGETGIALIEKDTPLSSMDDIASEGQSNQVVIRAKRYYGCGCGCCGCGCCASVAPVTAIPCGCGCCGCGYG